MTIEIVTNFLGIPIKRKVLQPSETINFIDSGNIVEDDEGTYARKRLNIIEVSTPDKITAHRSLWCPSLVSLGHLPIAIPYRLEKDEINQSQLGSHGIVSVSFRWKPEKK